MTSYTEEGSMKTSWTRTLSSYLKEIPKIQKPYSRAVRGHDVTVSSVQEKHDTARYAVSLHTNKHHSPVLYNKDASSSFLHSTASSSHTSSSSHAGNDCYSHMTNIINKKTFSFPLTFLVPSSWYDVTHHKDVTTSIHIQNLYTVQLKQKIIGFQLVFILPSSVYDVTGHEGLTTTTLYGYRVKQKLAFDSLF